MHLRRALAALLAATAATTMAATEAHAAPAASRASIYSTAKAVTVGTKVTITGGVGPVAGRPVALQQLSGRTWRTLKSSRTNSRGVYTFSPSTSARGTAFYRVTASGSSRYRAVTTGSVRLDVSGRTTVTLTAPTAATTVVPVPTRVTLAGKVAGTQPLARRVELHQWNGKAWVLRTAGTSSSVGAFAFTLPTSAPTPSTLAFRVVVPAASLATPAASAVRSLYVTPAATTVVMTPFAAPVPVGTPAKVTGKLTGLAPLNRPVVLRKWVTSGWVDEARGTADATGAFTFTVSTPALGTFAYTATAPATATSAAATATHVVLTVARTASTITLGTTPASAPYRTDVPLTGTVSVNPAGTAREVYLQRANADGTWTSVLRTTTSTTGAFQFLVPTTTLGTATYRVYAAATGLADTQTSASRDLTVVGSVTTLTLAPTPPSVPAGQATQLTGTVAGAAPLTRDVTLERRNADGTWTGIDTVTAATTGAFAFNLPTSAVGAFTYRVTFTATGTQGAATSETRALTVTVAAAGITVDAPPAPAVGEVAYLTGVVSGDGLRPVQLHKLTGTTWSTVSTGTTGADGSFAFTLPTSSAGASTYRVVAPATATAAAVTSATVAVAMTTPAGPALYGIGADAQSIWAQRPAGTPSTAYITARFLTGPATLNRAGDLATTEWDPQAAADTVYVTRKGAATAPVAKLPAGRCVAALTLAPTAASVVVVEGATEQATGRCLPDTATLRTTSTGAVTKTLLSDPQGATSAAVAYSPDGATVAAAWRDAWSAPTLTVAATGTPAAAPAALTQLTWVSDLWWTTKGLLVASDPGTGWKLTTVTSSAVTDIMTSMTGKARAASVTDDGTTLYWQAAATDAPDVYVTPLVYAAAGQATSTKVATGTPGSAPTALVAVDGTGVLVNRPAGLGEQPTTDLVDAAGSTRWSGTRVIGWTR